MNLLLVPMLLFCLAGRTQEFKPVSDISGFRSLYEARSAKMNTLKSDFVQEKDISMMKNKLVSEGTFTYKRGNKLRMEYTKPYRSVFVMENDRITMKNDQKTATVSVNSNKMFRLISQVTIDCVTGNILKSSDFKLTVTENSKQYYLILVPRQKMLKTMFGAIEILLSKSDLTVEKLLLKEVSGDHTTLIFKNKILNSVVPDEVFKVN